MFGRKISVDSELYKQLKQCAETGGYSSPEEFAIHVLEKAVDRFQENSSHAAESEKVESATAESAAEAAGEPVAAAEAAGARENAMADANTVAESAAVQPERGGDGEESVRR